MLAAAIVVVLALILALSGGLALLLGGSKPSDSDAEGWPAEVLGMPVLPIADAQALISTGAVDGRALAVAGWWVQGMIPSCPMPGRTMAELEAYCNYNIFASRGFAATTCTQLPGSTSCQSNLPPPGTVVVAPITTGETSGWEAMVGAANAPEWRDSGVPTVLVGHAADPRLWHCPAETRAECAHKFVVDRVMWVAGTELGLAPTDQLIATELTPVDAAETAAAIETALAVLPMKAANVPDVDPRLNGVGDSIVWLVRSLRGTSSVSSDDPTRAVDVTVVDDATGAKLSELGLEMDPTFQPGRLLMQSTVAGECCPGFDLYPFYRVELVDGTGVLESGVGGASGDAAGRTRFYAGNPAIVGHGQYVVRAWRAPINADGSSGQPQDECRTEITVDPLADVRVQADFPDDGACTFVEPNFGDNMF